MLAVPYLGLVVVPSTLSPLLAPFLAWPVRAHAITIRYSRLSLHHPGTHVLPTSSMSFSTHVDDEGKDDLMAEMQIPYPL